jgi:hypothetical protein
MKPTLNKIHDSSFRVKAVIGSLASAFMARVENSGSGIARVKKINSALWVW